MNASHWQHLCSSKQHTAFRSSVTEYLQHAEKNVLQLSEAKKLAEGIYDYTLACQLARIIDQTEPSVQSRVSLIESLVRIGYLDEANRLYGELPKEIQALPAVIYLRGKIDGWAAAKVGARIEFEEDTSSENGLRATRIYTARDEQHIITKAIDLLSAHIKPYLIDIGAANGIDFSNSRHLISSLGWTGLLIEPDREYASSLLLTNQRAPRDLVVVCAYANSSNICAMLKAHGAPINPGFLSLDIDSFEFEVLQSIFSAFRPTLLCVEINERVPPGIKYHALEKSVEVPATLLSGMSLTSATDLLASFNYRPLELHYNNLFAIPKELDNQTIEMHFPERTDQRLYEEGFTNRPDSFTVYPWNNEWRPIIETGFKDQGVFIEQFRSILARHAPRLSYQLSI